MWRHWLIKRLCKFARSGRTPCLTRKPCFSINDKGVLLTRGNVDAKSNRLQSERRLSVPNTAKASKRLACELLKLLNLFGLSTGVSFATRSVAGACPRQSGSQTLVWTSEATFGAHPTIGSCAFSVCEIS